MTGILSLAAVVLLAWLWLLNMRAREIATGICANACRRMSLQLLDGTVALHRMSPMRNARGSISLRRVYSFEYSDLYGQRYTGWVKLAGIELEDLKFEEIALSSENDFEP